MIDGYLHRIQLGALVAAARASTPTDAALITMLGLLGLGISGALLVTSVQARAARGSGRGVGGSLANRLPSPSGCGS